MKLLLVGCRPNVTLLASLMVQRPLGELLEGAHGNGVRRVEQPVSLELLSLNQRATFREIFPGIEMVTSTEVKQQEITIKDLMDALKFDECIILEKDPPFPRPPKHIRPTKSARVTKRKLVRQGRARNV